MEEQGSGDLNMPTGLVCFDGGQNQKDCLMRVAVVGQVFEYALGDFETYPQVWQVERHDVLEYGQTLGNEVANDSNYFFRTPNSSEMKRGQRPELSVGSKESAVSRSLNVAHAARGQMVWCISGSYSRLVVVPQLRGRPSRLKKWRIS